MKVKNTSKLIGLMLLGLISFSLSAMEFFSEADIDKILTQERIDQRGFTKEEVANYPAGADFNLNRIYRAADLYKKTKPNRDKRRKGTGIWNRMNDTMNNQLKIIKDNADILKNKYGIILKDIL